VPDTEGLFTIAIHAGHSSTCWDHRKLEDIVKEWLAQIVSTCGSKSPKLYHSRRPLSYLNQNVHQVAILEAVFLGRWNALRRMSTILVFIYRNCRKRGFWLKSQLKKLSFFSLDLMVIYCADQNYVRQQIERNFSFCRRLACSLLEHLQSLSGIGYSVFYNSLSTSILQFALFLMWHLLNLHVNYRHLP